MPRRSTKAREPEGIPKINSEERGRERENIERKKRKKKREREKVEGKEGGRVDIPPIGYAVGILQINLTNSAFTTNFKWSLKVARRIAREPAD